MNPTHPPPAAAAEAEAQEGAGAERVAVLGLGEAGRRYAADLAAAGRHVTGYDPAPAPDVPGVARAASAAEAVAGAQLVLGLTGAAHAVAAARAAAPALDAGACLADLNTSAPSAKREVERVLRASGALAADVAVLAPVPRAGAATPLLVSGPGAAAVGAGLRPLGADVGVLEGEPVGAAAARKLLRSVFMKGLAATVLEAVAAGEAAGCADWVREQIAGELGPGGGALVDRFVTGSRLHADRRVHEVLASRDYLAGLGARTAVCDAALEWLRHLAAGPKPAAGSADAPAPAPAPAPVSDPLDPQRTHEGKAGDGA